MPTVRTNYLVTRETEAFKAAVRQLFAVNPLAKSLLTLAMAKNDRTAMFLVMETPEMKAWLTDQYRNNVNVPNMQSRVDLILEAVTSETDEGEND